MLICRKNNSRKDTGYSTASSHTSTHNKLVKQSKKLNRDNSKSREKSNKSREDKHENKKLRRSDKETKVDDNHHQHTKIDIDISEESTSDLTSISEIEEKRKRKLIDERKYTKASTVSVTTTSASSTE